MSTASIGHNQTAMEYIGYALKEYDKALEKMCIDNNTEEYKNIEKKIQEAKDELNYIIAQLSAINGKISAELEAKARREAEAAAAAKAASEASSKESYGSNNKSSSKTNKITNKTSTVSKVSTVI